MTAYVLGAIGIWAVALAAWYFTTAYLRSKEAKQALSRLKESAKPVEIPIPDADGDRKPKAAGSKKNRSILRKEDRSTGKLVLALLAKWELMPTIERLLEQAGVDWKPARLAHACLGLFLVGFTIGWQVIPGNRLLVNLALGGVMGCLPVLHVLRLRDGRLEKFEEQFPDSLEFVSRSMRAGHAFSGALDMVHKEFQEPLSGEFKRVFEEHNLGLPLDQALLKLTRRVPSIDVQFFISAVLLQKRTGGNLAEILDKLAHVIRERFKLRGKIRAISAHGRMTGTALSAIPVVVGLLMFWVNPAYVKFFFEDEVGQYMAGAAIGFQLLGYGIINQIVKIEV
jgi:tight adherence protein B